MWELDWTHDRPATQSQRTRLRELGLDADDTISIGEAYWTLAQIDGVDLGPAAPDAHTAVVLQRYGLEATSMREAFERIAAHLRALRRSTSTKPRRGPRGEELASVHQLEVLANLGCPVLEGETFAAAALRIRDREHELVTEGVEDRNRDERPGCLWWLTRLLSSGP